MNCNTRYEISGERKRGILLAVGEYYRYFCFMVRADKKEKIKVHTMPVSRFGHPLVDFVFFTSDEVPAETDFEEPSRSDYFVLILLLKGNIKGRVNLQEFEISKNHLVLVTPTVVRQHISKSEDCKFIGFTFKSSFLSQLGIPEHSKEIFEVFADLRKTYFSLTKDETKAVLELMNQIRKRYDDERPHRFKVEVIKALFLALLMEMGNIATKNSNNAPRKISRKEDIVIRFGSLVMKHFKERKQLQFYADKIFVTPKYLTETVKEITGRTAGDIVDHLVIREAKLLLSNHKLSIGEIAHSLNFSDQSFFGKYFKRLTGLTPKEFRGECI